MKPLVYLLTIIVFFSNWSSPHQASTVSYDVIYVDNDGMWAAKLKPFRKKFVSIQSTSPCISPDGKYVAYIRYDEVPNPSVFVMNIETQNEFKLKTGVNVNYDPVWSPDNKYIAFNGYNGSQKVIGVAGKDNKTARIIATVTESNMYGPTWTTDGTGIIYYGDDSLFIRDITGKCLKKYLLPGTFWKKLIGPSLFVLTPDQKYIVCNAETEFPIKKGRRNHNGLYAIELATQKITLLTRPNMDCNAPVITSKGDIYFTGYDGILTGSTYKISVADTTCKLVLKGTTKLSLKKDL